MLSVFGVVTSCPRRLTSSGVRVLQDSPLLSKKSVKALASLDVALQRSHPIASHWVYESDIRSKLFVILRSGACAVLVFDTLTGWVCEVQFIDQLQGKENSEVELTVATVDQEYVIFCCNRGKIWLSHIESLGTASHAPIDVDSTAIPRRITKNASRVVIQVTWSRLLFLTLPSGGTEGSLTSLQVETEADYIWALQWVRDESHILRALGSLKKLHQVHSDPMSAGMQKVILHILTFDTSSAATTTSMSSAFELVGQPVCACASLCGRLWAVGSRSGEILLHNTATRGFRTNNMVAVPPKCMTFTDVLLFVSHESPSVAIYDQGLNILRMVQSPAGTMEVAIDSVLGCSRTVIQMCARGSLLSLVGDGGPIALLKVAGLVTEASVVAVQASNRERSVEHPVVRVLQNVSGSSQLKLIALAASIAYSEENFNLIEDLLAAFAKSYVTGSGPSADAFTGIFRRYFQTMLNVGYFERAYAVADQLNCSTLFGSLYHASVALNPVVSHACLQRCSKTVEEDVEQHVQLLKSDVSKEDSGDDVTLLLKLEAASKRGELRADDEIKLSRLLSLYRGYAEGVKHLNACRSKASASGCEEDLEKYNSATWDDDLAALLS